MRLWDLLLDNPIFMRELRRRMRGRGLIVTLCVYVASMCAWALGTIHWKSAEIASQGFHARRLSHVRGGYVTITDIGQHLSDSILLIQALLVLFVAPTVTAAMVRSEKERQTFDFLRGTAISPWTYVLGALLSMLLYVALALFCGFPVLMVSHLYGGVSDLLRMSLLLLVLSVLLSSGGLLISCATERGRTAHVVLTLLLGCGGAAAYGMRAGGGSGNIWHMFGAAGSTSGFMVAGQVIPDWLLTTVICAAVSAVMLLIAARKLFHPDKMALSYMQLGFGSAGVFGAAVVWHHVSQPLQTALAPAVPASTPDRAVLLIALLCALGLAAQCVAMLSPVEAGNERWKIRQRFPIFQRADDALVLNAILLAALSCIAVVGLFAVHGVVLSTLSIFPVAVFLTGHLGLCLAACRRTSDSAAALRLILTVDLLLLLVPALLMMFTRGGLFAGWFGSAADLIARIISPIEAGADILNSGLTFSGSSGLAVQCVLAMGAWAFYALQLRSPSQSCHDLTCR